MERSLRKGAVIWKIEEQRFKCRPDYCGISVVRCNADRHEWGLAVIDCPLPAYGVNGNN
jgi:hypothetical protein